ncbi:DNA-damage-inducible protein J [Clostridia bacterium]|nr:DNA-damage-inducible protein J [Clostridia bacterium]GHU74256.1 DNA-damage-inducible protein J [Clostridia bacterium]
MENTTKVGFRVNSELKKEAEELFTELGLNMTSALNMFLRKAVLTQGIPFDVSKAYKDEIRDAMREAERVAADPNAKTYAHFSELLEEIENEIANEI